MVEAARHVRTVQIAAIITPLGLLLDALSKAMLLVCGDGD